MACWQPHWPAALGNEHVSVGGIIPPTLTGVRDCCAVGADAGRRLFAAGRIQMRWKTSVPRTLRPPIIALPLATIVVGLTKRPDQLVVTLQSDVQFLDVWKTTRGPRTLPTRL
jgi:hypothetical protein